MRDVEKQANAILESTDLTTDGSMSGFILSSLAFLEKHKDSLPDTYKRATEMAEYSGYMQGRPKDGSTLQHSFSLQEASGAMEYLLKGLAAQSDPR